MLKVERLPLWTQVSIAGDNIDHQFAADIAAALGLIMQEDVETPEEYQACQFYYDLLDSNDEYSGSFSFNTDFHKWPTIRLYIDFGSEQELKYNALGGVDWLKNLLEKV